MKAIAPPKKQKNTARDMPGAFDHGPEKPPRAWHGKGLGSCVGCLEIWQRGFSICSDGLGATKFVCGGGFPFKSEQAPVFEGSPLLWRIREVTQTHGLLLLFIWLWLKKPVPKMEPW